MNRWMKFGLVASFVALSLLSTTGCNTQVSQHENQALKKELETVKKQLTDSRKQVEDLDNKNKDLEKTIEVLKTPEVPDTLLPQLGYFLEQQGESAFQSAYEAGTHIFNQQNVKDAKKMALTQYQHTMSSLATSDYIDREGKRLQDAWASKNPITFAGPDKLNQLTLQSSDGKQAIIRVSLTRTTTVSPYNGQNTTEDLTLLITMVKSDKGWKIQSTTFDPNK